MRIILGFFLLLTILIGCDKKEEAPSSDFEDVPEINQAEPQGNGSSQQQSQTTTSPNPQDNPVEKKNNSSDINIDAFLTGREVLYQGGKPLGARDRRLGEIALPSRMDPGAKERYDHLLSFVSALFDGQEWSRYIVDDSRYVYESLWGDWSYEHPYQIRVGVENPYNGLYYYNVRITGEAGFTEGEIVITLGEEGPLVAELLLDLDLINEDRALFEEPYYPETFELF